jgi:asparagine synthase (glutamine-hydrolysing)
MAGELRHRGPDGTGLYLDGRFGMANTRLAIIDPEGGDQPLSNEDGRYWVMQNGEIYNYVELQKELEQLGHRFSTSCDTEVIAHAYEEWGIGCLDKFNGDFLLAVWDRNTRELLLARDRFGVRPLFIAEFGTDFCFASEAKALFRHPEARRQLDPLGLVEAFTTWSILPDRSAFVGVRELAPGHYLRLGDDGHVEERRWWDLEFRRMDQPRSENAADLEEELLELLTDATRIRLRADVPVAAYLSGGLDSSLTAALAQRLYPGTLNSFGLGFADARYDESAYQDRFVQELGTSLERVVIDARDIAEAIPRAVELSEKPTLRTALAPLLRLSAAVQDAGLKVVITGEGADELFGGYDIFREDKVRRFWAREPQSSVRPLLFTRLNEYLARDLKRTGPFLTSFYARGLENTGDPLYSHRLRYLTTSRCLKLLSRDVLDAAAAEGDPLERLESRLPPGYAAWTPLGRAQYLEVTTLLDGYLLHSQGDRMLMGHSVEGRFPFLDYRVAELAAKLPDDLRVRGLQEKYLLRKAAARVLPPEISDRKKRPYRAPIAAAFVGPDAPDYVRELLEPQTLKGTGIFEPEAVRALVRKCEKASDAGVGETDEMGLVGTISTQLLHELLVARPASAAPAQPTKEVVGSTVRVAPEAAGAVAARALR